MRVRHNCGAVVTFDTAVMDFEERRCPKCYARLCLCAVQEFSPVNEDYDPAEAIASARATIDRELAAMEGESRGRMGPLPEAQGGA